MDFNADKKKEAVRALINLAVLEGFVLLGVVGVYFVTRELFWLVGGVAATGLIFGPLFYRWYKEHGAALKSGASKGA